MSFKDFFSFKGRLSSKNFWCYLLILCGVSFVIDFVLECIKCDNEDYICYYLTSWSHSGLIIPNNYFNCLSLIRWEILYKLFREICNSSYQFEENIFDFIIVAFQQIFSVASLVFFINFLRRRIIDIQNKNKIIVWISLIVFCVINILIYSIHFYFYIEDYGYENDWFFGTKFSQILPGFLSHISCLLVAIIGLMRGKVDVVVHDKLDNNSINNPNTTQSAQTSMQALNTIESLEQNLKKLYNLKEQGLITEEDYQKKKLEIL